MRVQIHAKNGGQKLLDNPQKNSLFEKDLKIDFARCGIEPPDVFFYEKTDSTNTRAKLYAENRGTDTLRPAVFFSHAQCAGRGTRGRSFESPVGGVYISFLLFPEKSAINSLALTTYAAVIVCRALMRISARIDPKIKWVNDITVRDKKLSGILTEGKIEDGVTKYAIVGIGINVRKADHTPEVKSIMTTLSDEGIEISEDELARVLAKEFFLAISDVGSDKILHEYKSLSAVIGRDVNVTDSTGTRCERVIDIDRDFSLITCDVDKNTRRYISADVSVLPIKS